MEDLNNYQADWNEVVHVSSFMILFCNTVIWILLNITETFNY